MSNALAVRHTTADSTARSNAANAAQVKRYWPGRAPDWYEQQQAAAEDSDEEEDREAEPEEEEVAATTVAAPVVLKKVSSFASKYLTSLGSPDSRVTKAVLSTRPQLRLQPERAALDLFLLWLLVHRNYLSFAAGKPHLYIPEEH